jgi:hypothetical protein
MCRKIGPVSLRYEGLRRGLTNGPSHCPWVNNCVANNNHRHFVLYILSLELGVLTWVRLALACEFGASSTYSELTTQIWKTSTHPRMLNATSCPMIFAKYYTKTHTPSSSQFGPHSS